MQIHVKKLRKNVETVTVKVPSNYEPAAVMLFDDDAMRVFGYALMYQSKRLKECLIDPNYLGRKSWLPELLHTNQRMIDALDAAGE